jgi:hypothetical protein
MRDFFKVQNDVGGSQKIRKKIYGRARKTQETFFVKIFTRTSHKHELFPSLKNPDKLPQNPKILRRDCDRGPLRAFAGRFSQKST